MKWMLAVILFARLASAEVLFEEKFDGKLAPGWSWVRENPKAWRVAGGVLEIRVEPGNMWGPENSGKNVLARELPESRTGVEISMRVENRPSEQYEQVDLVAYFDDGHMVKIGQELVDGKLSIVMGREEGDRTRTIAIIPLKTTKVELKSAIRGRIVIGSFRPEGTREWRVAGSCELPGKGRPRVAIQCYQGPKEKEHWAKITNFKIVAASADISDTRR
jgi:regulation of enolase protein 1 (concanavalin A-like superfamily)